MTLRILVGFLTISFMVPHAMQASLRLIPPDDPRIQYRGRWDVSDPHRARYSWPGVSFTVAFTGPRIGVRLDDHTNYFNVTIDGADRGVFHGTLRGEADYLLADNLGPGVHLLRFSRRNITFEPPYSLCGILLDSTAELASPPPQPARRIEFIGDSFTAAESNEASAPELPWEDRYPVTNIDRGFAAVIAHHYDADYVTTCRSGGGMVCDWRGDTTATLPALFNRTLMETPAPLWDFSRWVPQVAVIGLGLNDASGLRDTEGRVSDEKSVRFRRAYRAFISRLRQVYPGVQIVAVASFPSWIRENVGRVVAEETEAGRTDVSYCTYDEFPGGYVANGHPTVETHRKMAEQIIEAGVIRFP
jgi:hypothetical protein